MCVQSHKSYCDGSKRRHIAAKAATAPAGGNLSAQIVPLIVARGRSTRKYLRTKAFSRLSSGPPQLRQRTFPSTGETASTFTSAYLAAQWGQWNALGRNFSVMERVPN
jgi:hypothetical protein